MGIILAYSVKDTDSFEEIDSYWLRFIEKNLPGTRPPIVLVGTMCDVDDEERKVTTDQGRALAKEHGLQFFEVSAKESIRVALPFISLMSTVNQQIEDGSIRIK